MNQFKKFIESNRQMGTTTALIKATHESKGYLVVGGADKKALILKGHPELENQVFTYNDILNGAWMGKKPGPTFFDSEVVWAVSNMQDIKPPVVLRLADGYRVLDGPLTSDLDGYVGTKNNQLNLKLNDEDLWNIDNINKDFFEKEITNSTLGRILLRRGIRFYNKLRSNG